MHPGNLTKKPHLGSGASLLNTQADLFSDSFSSNSPVQRSEMDQEFINQFSDICDQQIEELSRNKSGKEKDNLKNMNLMMKAIIPLFSKMCQVAIETGVSKTEEKINEIDTKANLALFKTDKQDQKSRFKNLRLINVAEEDDEDLKQKVITVATKADVDIKSDDIDRVYRVGKKQPNAERPRVTHVSFKSDAAREAMMEKKKKIKDQRVFVCEDVTPARSLMLAKIRDHDNVERAFTREGKIIAYRKNHRQGRDRPETVETPDDLHKFGFGEDVYQEVIEKMKLT